MRKALAWFFGLFNVMLVECAWCPGRRIRGLKRGGKGITSSICPKCEEALKAGTWQKKGE